MICNWSVTFLYTQLSNAGHSSCRSPHNHLKSPISTYNASLSGNRKGSLREDRKEKSVNFQKYSAALLLLKVNIVAIDVGLTLVISNALV